MEVHCMPSIREELRVSEKLEPRIVGPTLETSTQILDSVYAKRTKVVQEVCDTREIDGMVYQLRAKSAKKASVVVAAGYM